MVCDVFPMGVCVAGDCDIEPPGLVCVDDRVVCGFSLGGVFVTGGCGMLTPGMKFVCMAAAWNCCVRFVVGCPGECVVCWCMWVPGGMNICICMGCWAFICICMCGWVFMSMFESMGFCM